MLTEESGASDESTLVTLEFEVASEELDRYVGSGDVVVPARGQ
jgi:hypothetical protein